MAMLTIILNSSILMLWRRVPEREFVALTKNAGFIFANLDSVDLDSDGSDAGMEKRGS